MTELYARSSGYYTFSLFDEITIFLSIASFILAIIAIWLILWYKKETDEVNRITRELLIKIEGVSKVISTIAWSELEKYGTFMRSLVTQNSMQGTYNASGKPEFFEAGNNTSTDDDN